mgnify:CR=1 FL=1
MLYEWLRHMDFAYPAAFGLLALLPFMIWWYGKKYDQQQAAMNVSTSQAFTAKSLKSHFRHVPFIFRMLALAALVIALARPQKRNDQQHTEGEGIDIILAMDVSGSMASTDILPSRMEVAKQVAEEFVRQRPVDRIGLVIFSGESFTASPLTTDKNALIEQIQTLQSRRYLIDGTVIGEGLATAVARLAESKTKSKVIILLTDGKEDPPKTRLIDPLTALDIAKSKQVKVYTIGMSALPTSNNNNAQQGKASASFLDEELLRKIADETEGRYFRAVDKEGLQKIYAQIDQLEKSKIEYISFKRYKELYLPFMLAALGFLFLEIVLRYSFFRKFP